MPNDWALNKPRNTLSFPGDFFHEHITQREYEQDLPPFKYKSYSSSFLFKPTAVKSSFFFKPQWHFGELHTVQDRTSNLI